MDWRFHDSEKGFIHRARADASIGDVEAELVGIMACLLGSARNRRMFQDQMLDNTPAVPNTFATPYLSLVKINTPQG
jgi:hypothetical protein